MHHSQCSAQNRASKQTNKQKSRHTKKQERVNQNQQKQQFIETDLEIYKLLELAEKK